ncbi:MAG: T9SS type A sorting domain-containing protein [Candidatus Cloacimonetes bacterium]|nr:T9SS type A sorting domain-containing protein [Candidatus Cloacimonadota bacterium]
MLSRRVVLIVFLLITCNFVNAIISQEEARNLVLDQILVDEIGNVDVYEFASVITTDTLFLCNDKTIENPYSSNWIYFVDDLLFALWEHPCRYIFIDEQTGKNIIVNETIYPENFNDMELISFIERPTIESSLIPNPDADIIQREDNPNLYAVIISTEIAQAPYAQSLWGSSALTYTTLTEYGFIDDNIFLHHQIGNSMYGADFNGDGNDDIDYWATYDMISSTFMNLAGDYDPGNPQYNPDIPELQEDDKLFVFVYTHGRYPSWYSQYASIMIPGLEYNAELFKNNVQNIDCQQITFFFQQCHSGGFVDILINDPLAACKNRVVHAACGLDEYSFCEIWETGIVIPNQPLEHYYAEMAYYWNSAFRGFFPGSLVHPWTPGDAVGEGNLTLHYDENGILMPEIHPDRNNDNVITLQEAYYYTDYHDTTSPRQINSYGDLEGIYDPHPFFLEHYPEDLPVHPVDESNYSLLELYCLEDYYVGELTESQTIDGDFLIKGDLIIGPEVTLTIDNESTLKVDDDASVTLTGKSMVEILNASIFLLEPGSSLFGSEHTIWVDPETGEMYDTFEEAYSNIPEIGPEHEIPGDRIVSADEGLFQANGEENNRITINCIGESFWDGFYLGNGLSHKMYYCDITNTRRISVKGTNDNTDAWLEINHSNITYCGQIYSQNTHFVIKYSLYAFNEGPIVASQSQNNFLHNQICYNGGGGIVINYSSDTPNNIFFNYIFENYDRGILLYDVPSELWHNHIFDNNGEGLVAIGNSNCAYLNDNVIQNNNDAELLALHFCFPDFYSPSPLHHGNTISDIDGYEPGTSDQYLLMCGGHAGYPHDLTENTIDTSDDSRFFPDIDAFFFGYERPAEKVLYDEGIENIIDENYDNAKLNMKDIIDIYTDTEIAIKALQWLTYLENFSGQDFEALRNYIEDIDSNINIHFVNPKNKAITSTYMMEENYEIAIERYEEVILNPPSVQDSIFALIDEGYCYLKLLESGNRELPQICSVKPKSTEEYSMIKGSLLSQLFGENNEEGIEQNIPSVPVLHNNFPNPFNPETTIKFSIPEDSKVKLIVYNIRGQKVKTLVNDELEKGIHEVIWAGKNDNNKSVASGVYFYKFDVNDKTKAIKKCLMLK